MSVFLGGFAIAVAASLLAGELLYRERYAMCALSFAVGFSVFLAILLHAVGML